MTTTVPSESYEQERFVNWLEANGYKFTSVPNSTFTRSYAVKARNKREGLRPGFPDLIICSKYKYCLYVIEIKRQKGGRVSPEQKEWIDALNEIDGIVATVCHGFDAARAFMEKVDV